MTGQTDGAEIIGDRKAKREFMARHDVVEYEPIDVPKEQSPREWEAEFAADVKRFMEIDPLNVPPVDVIGRTDTDGAGDIDVDAIEVFK